MFQRDLTKSLFYITSSHLARKTLDTKALHAVAILAPNIKRSPAAVSHYFSQFCLLYNLQMSMIHFQFPSRSYAYNLLLLYLY